MAEQATDLIRHLHRAPKDLLLAARSGSGDAAAPLRAIDHLRRDCGGDAPKLLRHYLERRTYAKALYFLAGRDPSSAPVC